jgi:hypothetical protein
MIESKNEEDMEYLIKGIMISIQAVLDKLDIACIDKNTEDRIINFCLQDIRCQKEQYDCKSLENLIERQLIATMW